MKKRVLALVLSICVAFSVVPEVALAEEPAEVETEATGEEESLVEEPDFEEEMPEEESEQIQEEVKSSDDIYTEKGPENAEESQSESEIDVTDELAQEGSGETIDAEQGDTSKYVQTAYFYITVNNSAWYYAGTGSVNALKAAGSIAGSRYTAGVVKSYPSSMPNITFNGITYTYDNRSNAGGNTYRVNWEYATVSRGANNGDVIITNDYVWRVDGTVILNGTGNSKEGFDLKQHGYNFFNGRRSFGYGTGYKIPLARYQQVYGNAYTKHIYKQNVSTWGGSCFGMALTSIMFYKSYLSLGSYVSLANGGNLNSKGWKTVKRDTYGEYTMSTERLTALIEAYQIWRDSAEYDSILDSQLLVWGLNKAFNYEGYKKMYEAVLSQIENSKVPYLLVVGNSQSGHALVVDSSRGVESRGNNWYRIFLYDCNNPYYNGWVINKPYSCYNYYNSRYVDVNKKTGEWTMTYMQTADSTTTRTLSDKDDAGIYFLNVDSSFPKNFNQKASFRSTKGSIGFTSDDITIMSATNEILFRKENGVITNINTDKVRVIPNLGVTIEEDIADTFTRLSVDTGTYIIKTKGGTVSYISNSGYAGIMSDESVEVIYEDDGIHNKINLLTESKANVNVVVENIKDENTFTSVETDLVVRSGSECEVQLEDDHLKIRGNETDKVTVDVISDNVEKTVENISFADLEKVDLKNIKAPEIDKSSWLYDDVPEKTGWRYEAIKYVKDHGIMNGISGTRNFAPDEPLTRAMFATIIYRMEGSPKASYSAKFPDVPDGNYFSVPIIWANKAGIINGHSNTGLFGTRENITREDMVVIMYRYCRVKGLASGGRADLGRFPDADQISGYAKEAVQWAVANGIINGRSNTGMLDPKGNASRVETAAIIQRFMTKIK